MPKNSQLQNLKAAMQRRLETAVVAQVRPEFLGNSSDFRDKKSPRRNCLRLAKRSQYVFAQYFFDLGLVVTAIQ